MSSYDYDFQLQLNTRHHQMCVSAFFASAENRKFSEEQKAGCWTSFTNIVAAEVRTAADKAAQLTVNAVDVAYDGRDERTSS